MLAALLSVAVLHWLVLVVPGANVLVVSQLGASGHRRAARFAALGVALVAGLWALLAILGVSAVFAVVPKLRFVLQLAGGMYLCWIAVRLWRSGPAGSLPDGVPPTPAGAFRLGVLTNITNPKSALFFGSVFATALPHEPGWELLVAAVALVMINAFVWHTFLAFAFSNPRVQAGYLRQRRVLNRAAGALVGAFGVRLLAVTASEMSAR
ncbi:MAG TPA: LysE family transporter [Burkholderiaceae bacterium]|nr:LysE family transporter [Burkholderiaceae bacterium]